jgi:hypothetical protein
MWVIAEYLPTAPFSLRPATATSSGGKTLLVPTPFALKMALLDACIRTRGRSEGERLFPAIRDLKVAIRLPKYIVVNNTFVKILRKKEIKVPKAKKAAAIARAKANRQWPFYRTIAFREYVHYSGPLALALTSPESAVDLGILKALLVQINYLGKRGGFMQLLREPELSEELPEGFIVLNPNGFQPFNAFGTPQELDDCTPQMTFEHADVYNTKKRITLGKERVLRTVVLPYALRRSSRSFSYYERI